MNSNKVSCFFGLAAVVYYWWDFLLFHKQAKTVEARKENAIDGARFNPPANESTFYL